MMRHVLLFSVSFIALAASRGSHAADKIDGRAEVTLRHGHERSLLMTEFWAPIMQDPARNSVFYGSLRLMGDDQDNREGNLGFGYRQMTSAPWLGEGVAGTHIWLDRRITERGSKFHQVTAGVEWLGDPLDLRLNGYMPLSDEKTYNTAGAQEKPVLSGTGITVSTGGTAVEEPQYGLDLELGWELGKNINFFRRHTDSFRVYGGAYYFDGDHTERVTGWRARVTTDITPNLQVGSRFQKDDERGYQGFVEATIRFPFGNKRSLRDDGLRARLDESPERDIDIVTGSRVVESARNVPVLNKETGKPQQVLTVDNTAAAQGDGSVEKPFNTLTAAQAAAADHAIIYVRQGNGTDTGQNQGIVLNKTGQQLIGSGSAFVYDSGRFSTANGMTPTLSSVVIAPATSAPVVSNITPGGNAVRVTADNVMVAGITVDGANGGGANKDGIVVEALGAGASAKNVTIQNVTAKNNRIGIYLHGANGGDVSAKVESAVTTLNRQHGIAVYDDTGGLFEVDLGGGTLGSSGNNILAGNTMEDLAIDYDGRVLAAMNNWWGRATGPDADNPSVGVAPQIYYGAPLSDNLVTHLTLDSQWIGGTTIYDRSASYTNATGQNGLGDADVVSNCGAGARECLEIDPLNKYIRLMTTNQLPTDQVTVIMRVNLQNHAQFYNFFTNNWMAGATPTAWSMFSTVGGAMQFGVWGVSTGGVQRMTSTPNIPLNEWVMLTGGYDGNTVFSTYNDNAFNSLVVGAHTLRNDLPVNIGDHHNGSQGELPYMMDEVRIYNRALTQPEIAEIYRMNSAGTVNTTNFRTSAP